MVHVKITVGGCFIRAQQLIVIVNSNLARKHVFARQLVATIADKALLIAIINHRHTAHKHHQRMAQSDPLQQFRLGHVRVVLGQQAGKPPHIMIAEKDRLATGHGSTALVKRIGAQEFVKHISAALA